ncbi:MAG: hypothetical protein KC413_03860 [Anaerolineales bacterium]|nr:hypothetical protein [Anaerolineales bacterium]
MKQVYWALGSVVHATYAAFIAEVTQYNNMISPGRHEWNPDQIITTKPIRVVYEALWKDEDDTIDLNIGTPDTPLTMGQILFAINNETYDFFKETSPHYFEGLAFKGGNTYELVIGS